MNKTFGIINKHLLFTLSLLIFSQANFAFYPHKLLMTCPNGNTVLNGMSEVCSGGGTGSFAVWQTSVNGANPLDAGQDPDGLGSIVYSSVLPVAGSSLPNNVLPTGATIQADQCIVENQSTSAYLYCDTDASGTINTGDTYTLLSNFSLFVYPEIQAPVVIDNSCQITLTAACTGDVITLTNQSVAAGVITNNGTNEVTYTASDGDLEGTIDISIFSAVANSLCTYTDNVATPDCPIAGCPIPVVLADDTGAVCNEGGVDDLDAWQQLVEEANPLDNIQDSGGFGAIVYSNGTPVPGGLDPDDKLPTGIFDGTDFCRPITQSVTAYLHCTQPGNETYTILSAYTLTVYPPLMSVVVTMDGSSCDSPTVELRAGNGDLCETLSGTCSANGTSFDYDFATTATGIALADAPAGCALPDAGSIACSNCFSIMLTDDPCSCEDPLNFSFNANFFFHEVIEITATAGQSWNLTGLNSGTLYDNTGTALTYTSPLPLTDNMDGTFIISVWVQDGLPYNATFEETGGSTLTIGNNCSLPSLDVVCPGTTNLGSYDCTTLVNIQDCPTTIVELIAAPYNLTIDLNYFCGTPVIICDDDEVPDVCEGDLTITREITVFDDLNENDIQEGAEPSESCEFTFMIIEDEEVPTINEGEGDLDGIIYLSDTEGSCPEEIVDEFFDEPEDFLFEDANRSITGFFFEDPETGMTWTFNAPTSTDNCGFTITELDDFEIVEEEDCYIILYFEWLLYDECENEIDELYGQFITIRDSVPPNIETMAADEIVSCEMANTNQLLTDWLDDNGGAEASDNCTLVDWSNDYTMLSDDGCSQTATVIFTAADECGNEATTTATFSIIDTLGPIIGTPSAIMNLTCFENAEESASTTAEYLALGGTITDNCSSSFTVFSQQTTSGNFCPNGTPYTISRTYYAEDECGITSAVSTPHIIQYLESQTGPMITDSLPTCYKYCADLLNPMVTDISYTTDCALGATVAITGPQIFGSENCNGTRYRFTYIVTDDCGRTDSATRSFIIGNNAPTIETPPFSLMINCGDGNNADYITTHLGLTSASTSCGLDATISYAPTFFDDLVCGESRVVTFTATDACGRTATATTTISLQDPEPPVFTVIPPPFCNEIPCSADVNGWYSHWLDYMVEGLEATDNCTLNPTIQVGHPALNTICTNGAALTVVHFVASDDCGNSSTVTGTFTILSLPPIFTFVPQDATIDCGDSPVFEMATAEDECGNLTITFEDVQVGDNCTGMITRTWTATNDCGVTATAESTITVSNVPTEAPTASISGVIVTEYQEGVSGVNISLENAMGINFSQGAEVDGAYVFSDLALNENYTVTPFLDENPLNGVSGFDLVLIAKHILQIQTLDSPYKLIAADVNRSGSITTLDLVALRKLILFINEEFENNTSWRFVEADYVFPNPAHPFSTIFPEAVYINGLAVPENHDFVGIKIGDVNNSVQASGLLENEERGGKGAMNLEVEDRLLLQGEQYEVAFKAADLMELSAFQFSLSYDPNQLDFVQLSKGDLKDLNESNFGFSKLNQGGITSSWHRVQPVSLSAGDTLFRVTFKAKEAVLLSEVLYINSRFTKAEAYDAGLNFLNVSLRFNSSKENNNTFVLYDNKPNPFKELTTIGFNLPRAGEARIQIYDLSGRMVYRISQSYPAGYNEVGIAQSNLSSDGVYYYQLITSGFEKTKKMLLQRL
jgi:hypothetical protein